MEREIMQLDLENTALVCFFFAKGDDSFENIDKLFMYTGNGHYTT